MPPPIDTAVAEAYTDDDGCLVCFMGRTGSNYVFQATADLNPPITWVNVSANTVPEPLLRVNDVDAVNFPYRFYRFGLLPWASAHRAPLPGPRASILSWFPRV